MATSGGLPTEVTSQEVFQWLKNLPLAPEYHPTLAEFQDPIGYIFKIEKEASKYGICKIVPPVLAAPKKTAIANLNRSLAARNGSSDSKSSPTFTTRQQQIGFCPRKPRPVQKPVWQSGDYYTFQEFEAKAKAFERNYLKKWSRKVLTPLEIETLYWKATVDKPFSVEYANDMPGSAFSVNKTREGGLGEGLTVGETEWNMRSVSRAKGSLLRFMKEEIPGVTSPMLYIAMMFSWFAWHVEDHDLHSLNYLHTGAGKTWYGVPKEAAVAFEEVVRVHGYGEEINPLVTFAVLGEKTTVMSPEVFISAGVPCCRLVQNAGEFVVTFPRAYHSGFSHGFNCGEAANIATPEWLRVAKEAAIRRASINYPPMVSHFQLLYDLALEFRTGPSVSINLKPRSSRLKDKQKGEGETLVKELFAKNVIQNNELLHILGKGSSVVLLPQTASDISVCSKLRVGSQLRLNPSFGLYSRKNFVKSTKGSVSDEIVSDSDHGMTQVKGFFSLKAKIASLYERSNFSLSDERGNSETYTTNGENERESAIHGDKLLDQRLFSCVTCGILSFDCVAVIQPKEAAARYLMSADCSFFNDWIVASRGNRDGLAFASDNPKTFENKSLTRLVEKNAADGLFNVPLQSTNCQVQMVNQSIGVPSASATQKEASSLGLLALNYANSSDSEEDQNEIEFSKDGDIVNRMPYSSESKYHGQNSTLTSVKREFIDFGTDSIPPSHSRVDYEDEVALKTHDGHADHRLTKFWEISDQTPEFSVESETNSAACRETNVLEGKLKDSLVMPHKKANCIPVVFDAEKAKFNSPTEHADPSFGQRSDEDSSRMHVFCLQHALEVEQQLRPIGGVHILLLCHPEYPRIEAEAKLVSEELGIDYLWSESNFTDATKDDEERIQLALDSEDAIPGNGDWAAKLGINLFYSANLSRSPLYSKQMPYNSVIYNAFGRTSPVSSLSKSNINGRRPGKQKKVVAGKWCGKVWMSNQVHPLLAKWDCEAQDQEHEQERNFHGWAISDEKLEKNPRSTNRKETDSVIRKYRRKRKMRAESRSIKKGKYMETEAVASDDSMEDNSDKKHSMIHSWNKRKYMEREVSYDSLDDISHRYLGKFHRSKQAKSIERDDSVSEDSLEDNSQQQFSRTLRSKQTKPIERKMAVSCGLVENNYHEPHRKFARSKLDKCVKAGEISDDSQEDYSGQWEERISRNMHTRHFETEDALSDDSLEESSHRLHVRASRRKQADYMDRETVISDDSKENSSHWQNRRFSKGTQAKYTEREDVASDDLLEERNYQQLKRFSKSKRAKVIEMEDVISDDSLGNNMHQQSKRILKNKLAKFIEREHSVSDESAEENTNQLFRTASRSKKVKFVAREDAVSDDLLVDDTREQPRRIPRSKKAKLIERETVVSDDLQEDNNQRHLRKTPRGKRASLIERDDAASDDLLEENSEQPSSRILRSKQNKQLTLRQLKLETSQLMKQGMSRLTKKDTPKSIKQERQTKQWTSRIRDSRNNKSRQINPQVEEELEGGPSTRLRQRPSKSKKSDTNLKEKQQKTKKNVKCASVVKAPAGRKNRKVKGEGEEYQCDIEGCAMSFRTKQELAVHKRNICPVKGCGKKFFSHKYLVQHRRVHLDDRPLKCPWKGCKMTFKWAWARTEHIRVHTGARPYVCAEEGCGQTFRFVSDFSRHKRKTGHSVKKGRG
ncbi:hypothetical protein K2173_001018 [Erythroxylum novogranatense]|uniref:Lysine-specific demethylase REF6 n=1 Tax=Erythroxylum novogranatense TaxID=1862640 RepID=A0AAV8SIE6_9ROSI|nr:hypothetical protein K2173_001018 [Erythroxylum novogranatense]